jgi:hypothetical protein
MRTFTILNACLFFATVGLAAYVISVMSGAAVSPEGTLTEDDATAEHAEHPDVFPNIAALAGMEPGGNAPNGTLRVREIPMDVPSILRMRALESAQSQPVGIADAFPALVKARAENLERLRAYALAGQFPQNLTDNKLTPVFVDDRDVPCAVGHLMRESGAGELVERIRQTDNLVQLSRGLPHPLHCEILAWVRTSGLTVAECALIQPAYFWVEEDKRATALEGMVASDALIASRLLAVHDKLVQDSTGSLLAQVRQMQHEGKGSWWIADDDMSHRVISNLEEERVLVRVSHFMMHAGENRQGRPTLEMQDYKVGEWKVLGGGYSVLVSPHYVNWSSVVTDCCPAMAGFAGMSYTLIEMVPENEAATQGRIRSRD